MSNSFSHVFHASIIGVLLYVVMKYGLKQSCDVAKDRSILIATMALVYMMLFGHKLPGKINPNIL